MRIDSAGIQFGTVLTTRDVGCFRLRESRYAPALVTPRHEHAEPYFSYIVRGSIDERTRRRGALYERGSVHFHPTGDPHHAAMGALGATAMSLTPRGRVALRLDSRPGMGRRESAAIAALAGRCRRELYATDGASDLALEALCLELVATSLRLGDGPSGQAPVWVLEARDYLHAHLDARVAVPDLARVAGVHPSHLARGFRRHLGISPGAYLRRLRIERARRSLAASNGSIAIIALEAGFTSQAHFTRAFHRIVGSPPGLYRRLLGRSR